MSSDGGWLNSRIKNVRDAQSKIKQKQMVEVNESSSENVGSANQEKLDNSEAKSVIATLKSIAVGPETIAEIMQKLEITREYRKDLLLSNMELNLKQEFPYFFTHPDLVRLISTSTLYA